MSFIFPSITLEGLANTEINEYYSNLKIKSTIDNRSTLISIFPNGISDFDIFNQNNVGTMIELSLDELVNYARYDGISDNSIFTFSYADPITSAKDIVLGFSDGNGTDFNALTINNNGNIGVDVISLRNWGSTVRAIQLGNDLSMVSFDDNTIGMTQGMYFNGSNWKYCDTGVAASVCDLNSGYVVLHTTHSGIADDNISPWTSLYLDPNGNFGLNVVPEVDCWSNIKMMEIGGNTTINASDGVGANGALYICQNAYINNTPTYRYISNDKASIYTQTSGTHIFSTAVQGSGDMLPSLRMKITNEGNIGINTSTFGTNAAGSVAIKNGTAPSSSISDQIEIFSTDISGGDATLGLRLEASVLVDTDETQFSHKIPIKINGTNYYLMLIAA